MALDKQSVYFPFAAGLNTKTDPKSLAFGSLLELENGVFTKSGAINKRCGYDILSRDIQDGAKVAAGDGLCVFGDELLVFDGTRAYSRLEATDNWIDRGSFSCVKVTDTSIVRNSYTQSNPSSADTNGLRAVAWEDSRGGVRYSLLDVETGAMIVADAVVDASGAKPHVVVHSGEFAIFYVIGTSIFFKRINPVLPTQLSAFYSPASSMHATHQCYDVAELGDKLYVAWGDLSDIPTVTYLLADWSSAGFSASPPGGGDASNCITVFGDPIYEVLAWGGAAGVKCFFWSTDLTAEHALAATTIDGAATSVRITGNATQENASFARVFWETTDAAPNQRVHVGSVTDNALLSTSVLVRSVGLAGKAFAWVDHNVYFLGVFDSNLQSTYFLFDESGHVAARISPTTAGGKRTINTLADITQLDADVAKGVANGIFAIATQTKGKLITGPDGTMQAQLGANTVTADFISSERFATTVIDKNLLVAGGVLQSYDGIGFTEHGFHVFPEGVTGITAAGGVLDGDGTSQYQWRVCYEWQDNFGQTHRSAPSPALIKTPAAATKCTLTIPTLRVSSKTGVNIAVYRTMKNGSVFYRVDAPSTPTLNDPTVDTVTFVDATVSDASLATHELLYTTGGVLDSIAPGSCSVITSYKGRAFLAGLSDPNRVSYTTITPIDNATYFNDALTIDVDPTGGPVTALGVLDDKLVIFKRNKIYIIAGNGPTNTGEMSDYGDPETITSDVGCIEPKSVVPVPRGLMFKSIKGIYMLDRGLNVTYLGAPVEEFNDQTITGAKLVPSHNQVRFVCSSGKALVYDYVFDQWSTFTHHEAVDCDLWNDLFVFLKSNGKVYLENSAVFTDGPGIPIGLRFVTSWLNIAGMQGFQRVWRAVILGDYKGKHKLRVRFGYDYHPEYTQELTIDSFTLLDPGTYGAATPYGTGIYGGAFPALQFDIHLAQQKCQSLRVSIEDQQGSDYNEGYSLSGIAFQVGAKVGTNKLRTPVRLGSEAVG